jgi:hypothetical protein
MNQRETFEAAVPTALDWRSVLKMASPALAGFVSVVVAYLYQDALFADLPTTRSPSSCFCGCSEP